MDIELATFEDIVEELLSRKRLDFVLIGRFNEDDSEVPYSYRCMSSDSDTAIGLMASYTKYIKNERMKDFFGDDEEDDDATAF